MSEPVPRARGRTEQATPAGFQLAGIVRATAGPTFLEVLRGVDLQARPGELVALVGPSGAGKSTLLHIAGLLERPDAGEVFIGGEACSRLDDARRTAHPPHQHRLRLPVPPPAAGVLGAGERHAAADDRRQRPRRRPAPAPATAGPARAGRARPDHRPGQLSGGEQQRVAIARALANAAEAAAGRRAHRQPRPDHRRRRCSTCSCGSPASRRLAAIIATHNPALAARMDRSARLEDGHLVEVVERPSGGQSNAAGGLRLSSTTSAWSLAARGCSAPWTEEPPGLGMSNRAVLQAERSNPEARQLDCFVRAKPASQRR